MIVPATTLAIILGVSECPRAPSLRPLPQCANSAADFANYLTAHLNLPSENLINLFDSDLSASDQIEQIEEWLSSKLGESSVATDLVFFYTGHGGFTRNDQAYFLAVRKTRAGNEGGSSIRYIDFASALKKYANFLRKYLILDCCFAASSVLQAQSDLNDLIIQRVEDELPPSGTAVLCSSAAKFVSLAPEGERNTMFSGALLDCLHNGVPGGPRVLTLRDIGNRARQLIQTKFPNDAVRPELHVPDQSHGGDLDKVALFPNRSWQSIRESRSVLPDDGVPLRSTSAVNNVSEPPKLPNLTDTSPASSAPAGKASQATVVAIGVFTSVLGWCTVIAFPYPFGLRGAELNQLIAPLGPAICLSFGLMLLNYVKNGQVQVLVGVATLCAWQMAWSIVCGSLFWITGIAPSVELLISSMLGSVSASVLLTCALRASILGWRHSTPYQAIRNPIALCTITGMAALPTAFSSDPFISLAIDPSLYIPWQTLYISTFPFGKLDRHKMTAGRFLLAGISTVILASIFQNAEARSYLGLDAKLTQPVELTLSKVARKPSPNAGYPFDISYIIRPVRNGVGVCALKITWGSNSPSTVSDNIQIPEMWRGVIERKDTSWFYENSGPPLAYLECSSGTYAQFTTKKQPLPEFPIR